MPQEVEEQEEEDDEEEDEEEDEGEEEAIEQSVEGRLVTVRLGYRAMPLAQLQLCFLAIFSAL
jgi:flagellar biosynthesis component FlhA